MPVSRSRSSSASRLVSRLAVLACSFTTIAAMSTSVTAAGQTAPAGAVTYQPPVSAPVLDPFRPPATPYGPGNRGIEYDTVPGDPVVSAAPGTIVFAGAVAGRLHVTVQHDDGVRTSYSFLQEIATAVGRRVSQGDLVGRAGDTFHFGVRLGVAYVDPADLLASGPAAIALVPHDTAFPAAAQPTRTSGLLPPFVVPGPLIDVYAALAEWGARRTSCTPPSEPVPAPPAGRRVAILVGGLGSSSTEAAIEALDTAALGFADDEVVRFSYAGGRVPGTGGSLPGIDSRPYAPADTLGDIRAAGERLARLIDDVATAAPDARIELIAHSQGGLVTRVALERLARAGGPLNRLGLVATIGSSHQGADLATLVGVVRSIPGGDALLEEMQDLVGVPIEPDSLAVAQLAEGSTFLRELAAEPPPEGVAIVSIGARGDLVVPAPRTRLPGATNVVVSVDGPFADHERLPSSPAVAREIALATAGRASTCEGLFEALADAVTGATVGWAESGFGLVPGPGAAW